ncbi:MAG: hypothetical protein JWQ16_2802, partial [Novosphingobium sp.]|nr:hypothetical protein [Novosphingobium sp.]
CTIDDVTDEDSAVLTVNALPGATS